MAPTLVTACTTLPPEGAAPPKGGPSAELACAQGKLYALKTLHPARAHDEQERAMLAHEGWLAARMQSGRAAEHLVSLHERLPGGHERSAFYLLYDWHSGETLQQQLDRGHKFSVVQVLAAATQTAKALGRLHRQCVIHRDVKPATCTRAKTACCACSIWAWP